MNYTTISNNFLATDLDNVQLINMSSQFTASEANELRQFLGIFEQLSVTSNDLIIKKILVNFKKTVFINNEGLIGLCQILKFAKNNNIDLRFLSFSPQIEMVLSLVGLEHLFAIESNDFTANPS
jgi:anti-anti-sigma regulatory factor